MNPRLANLEYENATASEILGDLEALDFELDDFAGDEEGAYQVDCKIRELRKRYEALTQKKGETQE